MFYRGSQKILPDNIEFLKFPIVIAVWYMDDGTKLVTRRKYLHGCIFNTQQFLIKDVKRMKEFFEKHYRWQTSIQKDKSGFRLYIFKNSLKSFHSTIKNFIIPSMRYKLPYSP